MPSSSAKQARFMAACAHDAGYASCPPPKVSREFNKADRGQHFAEGGLALSDGAIIPGNIDPYDRPVIHNADGSASTTRSFSIPVGDGTTKEVLLPKIVNGQELSHEDAIEHYHQTGEHLGIFPDWQTADGYASQLHNDQARRGGMGQDAPTAPLSGTFGGARVPDVAKLLRRAAVMHAEAEHARRDALRGRGGSKVKGYAKGGSVTASGSDAEEEPPTPTLDALSSAIGAIGREGPGVFGHYLKGVGKGVLGAAQATAQTALQLMPGSPMYDPATPVRQSVATIQRLYRGLRDDPKGMMDSALQAAGHTLQDPESLGMAASSLLVPKLGELGKLSGLIHDVPHVPPIPPAEIHLSAPQVRWNPADIPRDTKLPPDQSAIENALAERIASDPNKMIDEYRKLPETKGGRVIAVDEARELDPAYRADRSKSAAVHEPLSYLMKDYYAKELSKQAGPGLSNRITFTGGGTGSGKTTAVRKVLANDDSQLIYDTNLGDFGRPGQNGQIGKGAVGKIDQALGAWKDVEINYVYAEPMQALHQALNRAMKMERNTPEHSGRTVPLSAHLETHIGSNNTIRQLIGHYSDNPRVKFNLIDNSHGAEAARLIPVSELPHIPNSEYNNLREQATKIINDRFAEGSISPKVYEGFMQGE